MTVVSTQISCTAGAMYANRCRMGVNIQAVSFYVTTATPSALFKLAIYDDSRFPLPGNLVFASADQDASVLGAKTISVSLTPGVYWFAVHNTGPVACPVRLNTSNNPWAPGATAIFDPGVSMLNGISRTGQGTTPPALWPQSGGSDAGAVTFMVQGS